MSVTFTVVTLTFDDGPTRYTGDLLDLLDKYDAKATFFITGINNGTNESREGRTELARCEDGEFPWLGAHLAIDERHMCRYVSKFC
jgi:peptidoglycan/xylan/chitin deacetylase (PgdA/CDA1 family)